jgi:hypothetical protein
VIKKIIPVFFLCFILLLPITGKAASNTDISIDTYYLVVSPASDGSTNMMIMANYTNPSSQDYKGDGTSEAVLKISLPPGATGFKFLDSKIPIKQTDSGFITTQPIKANGTEVLPYSYQMPKDKSINLSFDNPVQQMQVLVPQGMGSVAFQGVDATDQGTFQFDNQNYVGYNITGIKAGQSFSMTYDKNKQPSGTTAQTSTKSTSESASTSTVTKSAPAFHNPGHLRMWEQSALHNFNPHIFLIVIIAIILAGIFSFVYFKRKTKLEEARIGADKEEKAFKLLMSKQKAILEKIIDLEETHGDGALSEEDYNKKLAAYKEHLVQVKLSLREFVE